MEPLSLQQVVAVLDGTLSGGPPDAVVRRVSTDSRWIRPGDLFVCLQGPRFDGHAFAEVAVEEGAVAVLAHADVPAGVPAVRVPDTLAALGRLGRRARESLPALGGRVVGITGTNGKTSTKELLAAALAGRYATVANERSYNNQIGVPLTLLAAEAGTEALVVELGTNRPGDIAELVALARPEVGVITNVGPGHLAGLKSVSGVAAEKSALLAGLHGRAVAVLNRDDRSFDELAARAPGTVISFGTDPRSDVVGTDVRLRPDGTRFRVNGEVEVELRLLGRHAVSNALAALAAARALDVPLQPAAETLARVLPAPGRLQLRSLGDLTLVDDSYNANPGSLAAALDALAELRWPGRLIAVVGDMLELGEASGQMHEEAGRRLAAAAPALLVAVGGFAEQVLAGARAAGLPEGAGRACRDWKAAHEHVGAEVRRGDVVLVKGSRGVVLDKLVERLADRAPTPA